MFFIGWIHFCVSSALTVVVCGFINGMFFVYLQFILVSVVVSWIGVCVCVSSALTVEVCGWLL